MEGYGTDSYRLNLADTGDTQGLWKWIGLILLLMTAGASSAAVVTFEDLSLDPGSFWNGSDLTGGFVSGEVHFATNYNADWDSWDGFAYANLADPNAEGFAAQYHAIAGVGQAGSANYAVAYIGWEQPPTITLSSPQTLTGLYVTNNNYAYYSMLVGSMFSKQFGGPSSNDEDWFLLTITGKDPAGEITGSVEFYLADFRFEDNSLDYVLDSWAFVDLSPLGEVAALEFALSSSDTGDFGMNTPAYFCLDTLIQSLPEARGAYTQPGISGYVDSATLQEAGPQDANAVVNPIFRGWATSVVEYRPADDVDAMWADPNRALGPVTGDNFDIVSLGELDDEQIANGAIPGQITLTFGDPGDPNDEGIVHNNRGYDFVVFENGLISRFSTAEGSMEGQMLAELAYVEVSSNGADFVRFPSVSLTPERVGAYGTIDIADVHNLAGKHPNAGGICIGTPFDLDDLAELPAVIDGRVDINDVRYVRLVDVPGAGDFFDEATAYVVPGTEPETVNYPQDHPIYDAWPTRGSGGFDLEAVGLLYEQEYTDDEQDNE
ncbi:MAG: DUF4465 domain-containing protein [Phycisphaerales bacterium]|nr:MAG: DUF4465 domain-containing protein [Phycisphaerales bacterium]